MGLKPTLLPVLAFIALAGASCQIGHEVHYFKAGENYYRIKINESSFASKSRYMSGFYDENAVDKYFSEMSQPTDTEHTKASDVSFLKPVNMSSSDKMTLDSNKQFVMILSSNSTAVSEQIGAFAENEQILESIARLANKSKIDESGKYADDIAGSYKRNKAVIDLGTQFISSLQDTEKVEKTKRNMAIFMQFLKDQNADNAIGAELLLRKFQKQ